jgi:hypothetical protein
MTLQDKEVLHLVADARYVTHSQLFRLTRLKALEVKRAVFNWRARRLVKSGLLRKQVIPYLGMDVLYSITNSGIEALEEMGITYLGGGYVKEDKTPNELQLRHVLEINQIRLALECSAALLSWTSEAFIRVLNLCPTLRYAKTYDAVVRVALGDNVYSEFAIEYERSVKSEQRYEKIVQAIDGETRLHVILYLISSYEVGATLRPYFQNARQTVLLAHVDKFKQTCSIHRWILRVVISGCPCEKRC